MPDLDAAIDALARDDRSSASDLLDQVVQIIRQVWPDGPTRLQGVGRRLCAAQPSMASVWSAVGVAWKAAEHGSLGPVDRFAQWVGRAPDVIAQGVVDLMLTGQAPTRPTTVMTCSASRTVEACLAALGQRGALRVVCAEGRPALEGRVLATRLADRGMAVELYTDAGLGTAIERADAVLVGADCVAAAWFVNKCGTRAIAAAANDAAVPVYVTASRDKLLPLRLAECLPLKEGPPKGIWEDAPQGVMLRNPFFERVPIALATAIVSDLGVLSGTMIAEACEARAGALDVGALRLLALELAAATGDA